MEKVKTKRYPLSRIRRTLLCAALGIRKEDTALPPQYAKVLAMNSTGMKLLGKTRKKTKIPILTKPASINKLNDFAIKTFQLESSATDFYTLSYTTKTPSTDWHQSPIIV